MSALERDPTMPGTPEWDAWFELQTAITADIVDLVEARMMHHPRDWRSAVYAAVIETLAERCRFDMYLSPLQTEEAKS